MPLNLLIIFFIATTNLLLAHDAPKVTLDALSAQLQNNPNQPHLLYHRAQLHEEAGNLTAALKDCETSLHLGLNKPYIRCKKLHLLRALHRIPKNPEPLFRHLRYQSPCEGLIVARIYLEKKQKKKAQHTLHQRVLPFTLNTTTFHETIDLLIHIDPSDAIPVLQKHLNKGRDLQAFIRLLDLQADTPETALESIASYGKIYETALPIIHKHANYLAQTGQRKKAIARYEQALRHLNKQPAHRKHSDAFTKTTLDLRKSLSNLLKKTTHEPL